METLRNIGAWAAVWIAFLFWGAYAASGVYIAARLHRYCNYQWPPKAERWNPDYYDAGAGPWIRRDRLWTRWKWPVLVGGLLFGNGVYLLLKP